MNDNCILIFIFKLNIYLSFVIQNGNFLVVTSHLGSFEMSLQVFLVRSTLEINANCNTE